MKRFIVLFIVITFICENFIVANSATLAWSGQVNLDELLSWNLNYGAKVIKQGSDYITTVSRTDGHYYGTTNSIDNYSVDYDKNPYFEITISGMTQNTVAYFQLKTPNMPNALYFASGIGNGVNKLPLQALQISGLSGVINTSINIGIQGDKITSSYIISSIKLGYADVDNTPINWGDAFVMDDLINWNSGNAKIYNEEGKYILKETRTDNYYFGTASSPNKFSVDFSRNPYLLIDISDNTATPGAYFQLKTSSMANPAYFADNISSGKNVLPLKAMEAVSLSGIQSIFLYFGISGSIDNTSYVINNIELLYEKNISVDWTLETPSIKILKAKRGNVAAVYAIYDKRNNRLYDVGKESKLVQAGIQETFIPILTKAYNQIDYIHKVIVFDDDYSQVVDKTTNVFPIYISTK